MQFKIPQNIAAEDKLIGPLSLRQLIIVSVGGGLAYMIYMTMVRAGAPTVVYLPPIIIISLLTVAIAFFKKDNLTFTRMVLLLLEMTINPPKRIWVQMAGDQSPFKLLELYASDTSVATGKTLQEISQEKKLEDIGQIVQALDYTYTPYDDPSLLKNQNNKEGQTAVPNFVAQIAKQAAESAQNKTP